MYVLKQTQRAVRKFYLLFNNATIQRFSLLLLFMLFSTKLFAQDLAVLESMRIQGGATLTRITFELSKMTQGGVKYLPRPDRVVIQFENTMKHFNMQNVRLAGANVLTINAQSNNGQVQIIFTVTSKPTWKIHYVSEKQGHAVLELEITTSKARAKKISATSVVIKTSHSPEFTHQDLLDSVLSAIKIQKKPTILTVVIDPGHGGKDPGATGQNGMHEKTVVLSIAKKIAYHINQMPNMRAVMTRDRDVYLPLRERMAIARKNNADVFVAIHADAYYGDQAQGASIYTLSKNGATSEAARWLAQRENYSEIGSIDFNSLPDHSLMLRSTLIDMAQTETNRDSVTLANKILNAIDDFTPMHVKRVEKAPFVVLKSPDIPSVLIETGFITNPSEEKRLADPLYQDKLAFAISNGIRGYVRHDSRLPLVRERRG